MAIHPLEEFPTRAADFDLTVYHLGNNPYHAGIYDLALRFPGAVVLHDYVLHHLIAHCTLQAGDIEGYLWHLAYERGSAGVAAAIRRQRGIYSEREQFLEPLNRVLLDHSMGALVHSRWSADQVRRDHPHLPICHVPHHLASGPPCAREEARSQLGITPGDIALASFGFIARHKRVDSLLRAYAQLRREHPQVRCFLVGEPHPSLNLPDTLDRLGLRDHVVVTGYVDMQQFHLYMAACDIAVNLRYPSAGETSGALVRLLGSGKAVIISNVHQFAEWPDDICLKVDLGPAEESMLLHYLRRLVQDGELRRHLGENARRYTENHHAMENSVRAYLSFFQDLI
jgi:glycosyltransferase involved in cell wall biosynthesis